MDVGNTRCPGQPQSHAAWAWRRRACRAVLAPGPAPLQHSGASTSCPLRRKVRGSWQEPEFQAAAALGLWPSAWPGARWTRPFPESFPGHHVGDARTQRRGAEPAGSLSSAFCAPHEAHKAHPRLRPATLRSQHPPGRFQDRRQDVAVMATATTCLSPLPLTLGFLCLGRAMSQGCPSGELKPPGSEPSNGPVFGGPVSGRTATVRERGPSARVGALEVSSRSPCSSTGSSTVGREEAGRGQAEPTHRPYSGPHTSQSSPTVPSFFGHKR